MVCKGFKRRLKSIFTSVGIALQTTLSSLEVTFLQHSWEKNTSVMLFAISGLSMVSITKEGAEINHQNLVKKWEKFCRKNSFVGMFEE